jgi:hypothetical protein
MRALSIFGPLGRGPHHHAISKDWADDRVHDSQFRSDTKTRRQQDRPPSLTSSETLPICSGNMLQEEVSHMPKY